MPIKWDRSRRICISKFIKPASKSEIWNTFQKYGKIDKLWIARNPSGFALLQYTKRIDAERATRTLNGTRCCGSIIKVQLSETYCARRSRRAESTSESNQLPRRKTHRRSSIERSRTRRHVQSTSTHNETHRSERRNSERRSTSERSQSRGSARQYVECSICLKNILERQPTITVCGHMFCNYCINRAIQQNEKCPKCRGNNKITQLKLVYL